MDGLPKSSGILAERKITGFSWADAIFKRIAVSIVIALKFPAISDPTNILRCGINFVSSSWYLRQWQISGRWPPKQVLWISIAGWHEWTINVMCFFHKFEDATISYLQNKRMQCAQSLWREFIPVPGDPLGVSMFTSRCLVSAKAEIHEVPPFALKIGEYLGLQVPTEANYFKQASHKMANYFEKLPSKSLSATTAISWVEPGTTDSPGKLCLIRLLRWDLLSWKAMMWKYFKMTSHQDLLSFRSVGAFRKHLFFFEGSVGL